jgi:hypothetical protein
MEVFKVKKIKMMTENSLSFEQGCNLYLNNALSDEIRLSRTLHYESNKG